jgi:5-methylcytosine-specific restriction endonuclease McrA
MKIGQLVKAYTKTVFRYCDEGDHEELMRLMDVKYSKDILGINFPFCAEVETISPELSKRYWRDIHVVRGRTVRVCSQWVDLPKSKSRELFCRYLLSRKLADDEELSAIGSLSQPHLTSKAGPRKRAARGRYRNSAIGNAQNLFVRNILSNIGQESFNENDWQETKAYFMNKCAYCGAETNLVIDHAIPINKAKLGEHRIGNLVPSCKGCNDRKGNRDYNEYLNGDDEKRRRIESYMDSKNYVPLGNNEQVRMILDLAHAEVSALVDRYIVIINSLFPDDPTTRDTSVPDDDTFEAGIV